MNAVPQRGSRRISSMEARRGELGRLRPDLSGTVRAFAGWCRCATPSCIGGRCSIQPSCSNSRIAQMVRPTCHVHGWQKQEWQQATGCKPQLRVVTEALHGLCSTERVFLMRTIPASTTRRPTVPRAQSGSAQAWPPPAGWTCPPDGAGRGAARLHPAASSVTQGTSMACGTA